MIQTADSPSGRRKSMENMEMIKMTPDAKAKQAEGKYEHPAVRRTQSTTIGQLRRWLHSEQHQKK